jgi:RNA polymerase sigma-70 factor (ECF subfamily)
LTVESVLTPRDRPLAHETDEVVRLERAARENYQFIWRCLRRLGVRPDCAVDDAAQRVFEVAARKRRSILPGCERAFFFKTAVLVAAETRRPGIHTKEVSDDTTLYGQVDPTPGPEELTEQHRCRQMLDLVLDTLPMDLKTVFVLFELERMAGAEIARLLDIPHGTVASRLRRARQRFNKEVERLMAARHPGGGAR